MATKRIHPKSLEAYKQLKGRVFSGRYHGIHKNKDYGTKRAIFEVDSQDPDNENLLDLFSTIREWNPQSEAKVRFLVAFS